MKKSTFLLAILFISLLYNFAFAGDRMVLVERFTSSTCPPCASNNPIMDAWLASQDIDRIIGISYHMNWPAPGNDPFYLYNPSDNNTRRTFYNVNYIPQAKFDGIIQCDPSYSNSQLTSYFNMRKDSLSPVTIIITDSTMSNNNVTISALVFCESLISNPNVTVQFAVMEKFKHFNSPPGANGELDFYDIMRKMLPNGNGQTISLLPGQMVYLQWTYPMDAQWQANQIKNLIFVQGAGSELLNAAVRTQNFTMLPNPGFKVVYQGQSQNATYKIKVPVVAPGYNSQVTLTAEVNPSVSGITTSFPSGNVINNFPDSATLQVSSTSSVPAGAYRIVVTGTNAANRVHKTTVNYLVGKNYIFVNSNKSNLALQFKIDGIAYTTPQLNSWDLNSQHLLEAVTPQVFGATQYVFQSWSNGGSASQNVTIGTTTSSYIVNYKTQYKAITMVSPSSMPVTISGGNIFYDSASNANISVSPVQLQYQGQTWYFQNWTGSGNGSYSGNNPSPTIMMNNPVVEQANYDTIPPIGIIGIGNEIPKEYALHQNYPNPFNPVTIIKFELPKSGNVTLKLYDVLGNEVAVLIDGYKQAGYYEAQFNGANFASGVYFYKLSATGGSNDFTSVRRLVILK